MARITGFVTAASTIDGRRPMMNREIESIIPYESISTLFLDVGNTLVSMDFKWIREELSRYGLVFSEDQLRLAEAAARPILSAELNRLKSTETEGTFRFYFMTTLKNLIPSSHAKESMLDSLCTELLPIIKNRNKTQRLWSSVLPGVSEALQRLHLSGIRLVAVSNADGTVEAGLTTLGLRGYFDAVIDSHVVGYEKPDPRIFYHALSVCGADPAHTLHVGDIYGVDVLGARSAGIHAVLLDPHDVWPQVDCPKVPDLTYIADCMLK